MTMEAEVADMLSELLTRATARADDAEADLAKVAAERDRLFINVRQLARDNERLRTKTEVAS